MTASSIGNAWLSGPSSPNGGDHAGEREHDRHERGDDRAEREQEHDQRDRDREELGAVEVAVDSVVARHARGDVAGLLDGDLRVRARRRRGRSGGARRARRTARTVPMTRTAWRSGEMRVSTLPPTAEASRAEAAAVAARNSRVVRAQRLAVEVGVLACRRPGAGSGPSSSSRAPTRRRRRSPIPRSRPRSPPPRRGRRTRARPRSPTTDAACSSDRRRPPTSCGRV